VFIEVRFSERATRRRTVGEYLAFSSAQALTSQMFSTTEDTKGTENKFVNRIPWDYLLYPLPLCSLCSLW